MSGPVISRIFVPISYRSSVSVINSTETEVLIVNLNPSRKGLIVYNESGYNLYMKFDSGVSSLSFTVKVPPGSTYEMQQNSVFAGTIYGVWDKTDGVAHITEML